MPTSNPSSQLLYGKSWKRRTGSSSRPTPSRGSIDGPELRMQKLSVSFVRWSKTRIAESPPCGHPLPWQYITWQRAASVSRVTPIYCCRAVERHRNKTGRGSMGALSYWLLAGSTLSEVALKTGNLAAC